MSNFDFERKKNRQKTVKKRPKTTKGTYSLYRLYAITLRQFKFFTFLAHVPYFKAVFLYTLPEPSGILSECHILPIPDSIYIQTYFQSLNFNILWLFGKPNIYNVNRSYSPCFSFKRIIKKIKTWILNYLYRLPTKDQTSETTVQNFISLFLH